MIRIQKRTLVYLMLLTMSFSAFALAADEKDVACDDKHANACVDQGEALIRKNQIEAGKQLLIKACDYREARGCLKAGIIDERMGNFSGAKSFYQKACDIKEEKPCKNVGIVEKKIRK